MASLLASHVALPIVAQPVAPAAVAPATGIAAGEPNPSAPKQGADTPLVVPEAYRVRYAQAVHDGIASAKEFAKEHTAKQKLLISQWTVWKTAYPPSSDAADLAELHTLQDARTPEGVARAQYWAKNGLEQVWQKYLDQYKAKASARDAKAAQLLFDDTMMQINQATDITKSASLRDRPWVVDKTIQLVVDKPGNNPSFPSGHTSAAYGAAIVLAHLMPDRKAEFMGLAQEASFARLYAGVHFPTDVMEGAKLASTIASYMVRVQKTTSIRDTRPAAADDAGDAAAAGAGTDGAAVDVHAALPMGSRIAGAPLPGAVQLV